MVFSAHTSSPPGWSLRIVALRSCRLTGASFRLRLAPHHFSFDLRLLICLRWCWSHMQNCSLVIAGCCCMVSTTCPTSTQDHCAPMGGITILLIRYAAHKGVPFFMNAVTFLPATSAGIEFFATTSMDSAFLSRVPLLLLTSEALIFTKSIIVHQHLNTCANCYNLQTWIVRAFLGGFPESNHHHLVAISCRETWITV